MGSINMGRVVIGGLLAGLVLNISETILNLFVVNRDTESALLAMNLPLVGGPAIGGFVVMAFLLGIMTVWLYAAIRPRFGAGMKTAVCAGLVVWFFAYLYNGVGMALMHVFPPRLLGITLVWGLVEIVLAAIAGGWAYKES